MSASTDVGVGLALFPPTFEPLQSGSKLKEDLSFNLSNSLPSNPILAPYLFKGYTFFVAAVQTKAFTEDIELSVFEF